MQYGTAAAVAILADQDYLNALHYVHATLSSLHNTSKALSGVLQEPYARYFHQSTSDTTTKSQLPNSGLLSAIQGLSHSAEMQEQVIAIGSAIASLEPEAFVAPTCQLHDAHMAKTSTFVKRCGQHEICDDDLIAVLLRTEATMLKNCAQELHELGHSNWQTYNAVTSMLWRGLLDLEFSLRTEAQHINNIARAQSCDAGSLFCSLSKVLSDAKLQSTKSQHKILRKFHDRVASAAQPYRPKHGEMLTFAWPAIEEVLLQGSADLEELARRPQELAREDLVAHFERLLHQQGVL